MDSENIIHMKRKKLQIESAKYFLHEILKTATRVASSVYALIRRNESIARRKIGMEDACDEEQEDLLCMSLNISLKQLYLQHL